MKKLSSLLLLPLALLATLSQEVENSFSPSERESLLQELESSQKTINKTTKYTLSKGWNLLTTPANGVDVASTFTTSSVTLVASYDFQSKIWATYSLKKSTMNDKTILLKYLEPRTSFFVLANEDTQVDVQSTPINASCKKMMDDDGYSFMIHSALESTPKYNAAKSVSIESRYLSHYEKNTYNDTRVMFIYPKIKNAKTAKYNYGPASPKVAISYAKEYKNKKFYIYDYRDQKCYEGIFPSIKIPPFPILKGI